MKFSKKSISAILSAIVFSFSLCLTNVRAATQSGFQDASESEVHYVSEIFEIHPWQFGLRGDPGLWDVLKKEFDTEKLLPSIELSPRDFEDLLVDKICKLCRIEHKDFLEGDKIYVEDYDGGSGMSRGMISLKWWRDEVKILSDRYYTMVFLPTPLEILKTKV